MAKPVARTVARRKDGADITFKDYKGDVVTKALQPVASFFPNRFGGLDCVFEKGATIDTEKYFYNTYVDADIKAPPRKGDGPTGPAPRTAPAELPDF